MVFANPPSQTAVTASRSRELYVRASAIVKHAARASWIAALGVALLPGCAAPTAVVREPFLIAVRYDVAPRWIGLSRDEAHPIVRRDFQAIRRLGFGAALLQHVGDEDRQALLDMAAECELSLAIPDRVIDHFVRTGAGETRAAVRRDLLAALAAHPAFAAVAVAAGSGESCSRSAAIRESLIGDGFAVMTVSSSAECTTAAQPAVVRTAPLWEGSPAEASARLLEQYVVELREGKTAGVIVDRFARLPGDPAGLSNPPLELHAGHRAALAELLTCAQRWGPLLAGSEPSDISADPTIRQTLFQRGARRYVLIHNPAKSAFLHRELRLPADLPGPPAARAVEIPPTTQSPGAIRPRQKDGLTVPLDLPPNGATLLELF